MGGRDCPVPTILIPADGNLRLDIYRFFLIR